MEIKLFICYPMYLTPKEFFFADNNKFVLDKSVDLQNWSCCLLKINWM